MPSMGCAAQDNPIFLHLHAISNIFSLSSVNGEWRYFRSCAFLGEPGVGNDERFVQNSFSSCFVRLCSAVNLNSHDTAIVLIKPP